MIEKYAISGMTCQSCVARVSDALETIDSIERADVQLNYPQAKLITSDNLNLDQVNLILKGVGNYAISKEQLEQKLSPLPEIKRKPELPEESLTTYKPLLLIVSFIAGTSLLAQFPFEIFSGMLWMRHFMAGFFIVFSFFKLLNLKGFSNSYRMYDIVAARWNAWGYIYPFVELGLGILYLIGLFPVETNLATALVLGISSIGVIQSNLNKKQIKCACLGDVFNLPMSTVTIVEDLVMVGMAVVMLVIN